MIIIKRNYLIGPGMTHLAIKEGIMKLHGGVRLGVYISYRYYRKLFHKIKQAPPQRILQQRYRVNNITKLKILATSSLRTCI